MTQFMIVIGFLAANWVGYGCIFFDSDAQWRVPLSVQVLPAVLLFVGMFFLPYSPRWLIEKGRNEEALKVIKALHGNRSNQEFIEGEFAEMIEQIKYEKEHLTANISDLWKTGPMRRRTLTGIAIQLMTQSTGINVGAYFQPTLYAALGYSGDKSLMLTGINGALGAIVTFSFIALVIDRIGRKKPLIFGALGMAASLGAEAAINALYPATTTDTNTTAQTAGVALLFSYAAFFNLSFGPVSWVYQSEIFPMRVRSIGTAVCTCSNWAANVVISQITPLGLQTLGWKLYIFFACTNVVNALTVIFFFPETKGRTLEEMDAVFGDRVPRHELHERIGHHSHHVDEKESVEKIDQRV